MQAKLLQAVQDAISQASNQPFNMAACVEVGGGDSHSCYRISDQHKKREFFVKTNTSTAYPMLTTEAVGLGAIAATNTIATPAPITHGCINNASFLVLTYLPLQTQGDDYLLGQQLAKMHQAPLVSPAPQYGFTEDNFIGQNPQANHPSQHWCEFWLQQRLMPQLDLARRYGFGQILKPLTPALLEASHVLLSTHQPRPCLVHGDLWRGNAGFVEGRPVIFDPAAYIGDREVDVAMTELFGGFSPAFYQGYQQQWPLDKGYAARKPLYNLYHLLNHVNLFGEGYMASVVDTITQLSR